MSRIYRALAGCLLVGLMALTACSGTSTGNGNGTSSTGPTSKATAKPKPTGVPTLTVSYCQGLMTVAEANQFMKPATPATSIDVVADSDSVGASCDYGDQTNIVVRLLFAPYQAGLSLDTALTGLQSAPGAQVTRTPVSGIGDQAEYVVVSASSSGATFSSYYLLTTTGSVELGCITYYVGSSPTTPQQPALTAVCQQVVSRM